MIMKLRLLFLTCVALVSVGCASQQETIKAARTITILHTNDLHAAYAPQEATWIRQTPRPLVGGFRELEFTIDSIRKATQSTMLLDAGDVMTGTPISDLEYKGADGGALFEIMSRLGYDAWAIGNHDFDISQENLIGLTKIAGFPSLSANIVNDNGEFPVSNKEYVIIERGGLRIGVLGLMSQELYGLVNQSNLIGIKVLSPVETARRIIGTLDPQTDLIIAVTHQGVQDDSILAASVEGLDIIVGGHSHTRLTKPKIVNNVIIVQAGSRCQNLGVLEVTVENDKVTRYDGRLVQLWARDDRPTTPLASFLDSIHTQIEKEFDVVVAQLKSDWTRAQGESNIGHFLADAQREAALADIGFMNAHGIRANIPAGPLTRRDLYAVLPFRNILTTFQLSGKQLKQVLVDAMKNDDPLITSGMTAKYRKNADGSVSVVEMTIGGKPVDENRMYVCAATDYFVGQGKKYIGIEINQPVYSRKTVYEALEEYARKQGTIPGTFEPRIIQVK